MTGHRPWSSLKHSRRVRLRSRVIRLKWRVQRLFGRCGHHATFGPAGGDVGRCLVCGSDVDWDGDE